MEGGKYGGGEVAKNNYYFKTWQKHCHGFAPSVSGHFYPFQPLSQTQLTMCKPLFNSVVRFGFNRTKPY